MLIMFCVCFKLSVVVCNNKGLEVFRFILLATIYVSVH